MINVNQLTSELRMMPDQALQRMAMMYKNDPYIFPMVISEDMARKKLRQAAQAQAVQPQPTVKDQALMAMGEQPQAAPAPGIAALQAPNMQGMADGGIAGYDDMVTYADGGVAFESGVTPSYQRTSMSPGMLDFAQKSEPVVRMAEGGVARYQDRGLVEQSGSPFSRFRQQMFGESLAETERLNALQKLRQELQSTYSPLAGIGGLFKEQSDLDRETAIAVNSLIKDLSLSELQALKQYGLPGIRDVIREKKPELFQKLDAEARARAKPPAPTKQPLPPKTGLSAESLKTLQNLPPAYEAIEAAYGPDAERMPQPLMTAAQRAAAGAAGAAGAARAPSAGAAPARPPVDDVTKAKTAAGEFFDEAGRKADVETYVERVKRNIAEGRTTLEKAQEKFRKEQGVAYAGLQSLLDQEGVEAKKGLEQDKAMAILNAGLAMMAGTSPRALENIGKGAMVGTGQYAEAMKDFKKAAKERQRAMADIEQARRAEARDDAKAMMLYDQRGEERLANAEEFGIKGIMSLTDAKAGAAASIFNRMQGDAAAMQRLKIEQAGLNVRQERDIASRASLAQAENATRIALASMPGTEERLIRAFGTDQTFRKAYEEFRSLGADQKALQDMLVKVATSPGGMQLLKTQDPDLYRTLQEYSSRLSGVGIQAVGSVPQGAGVRP